MRRLVYDVEARVDVLGVVEYYERVANAELADRFTSELQKYLEYVASRPESLPEIRSGSGIRRANLSRFPHHVLFQIADAETIKILAIKHDRRHPDMGLNR